MEKLHLFVFVCLFCALVSFTFISDYQPVVRKWQKGRFFRRVYQNNTLSDRKEVKPMKIVIWMNPTLSKDSMEYRRKFVMEKMIVPQNTGNDCFKEKYKCEMTLENDEKTLREAAAIIFIEFAHYFNM